MLKFLIMHKNSIHLQRNLSDELDLVTYLNAPENAPGPFVCSCRNGDTVKLINMNLINETWVEWTGKEKLSENAYWALKCYFVKSRLVGIAMSNPEDSINRSSILKLIGLIDPVFMGGNNER